MIDVVVDSCVVLAWIRPDDEPHAAQSRAVLDAFSAGRVRLVVSPVTTLEILNVAGRKWRWQADELAQLVAHIRALRFETPVPPLTDVARWTAAGLSAYDASYVAVAEAAGAELITADGEIVAAAPGIARALADASASPGVAA